jgi:hypothetical protein
MRWHGLVGVSFVQLLSIHISMRPHGTSLHRSINAERQMPRVQIVFGVHGTDQPVWPKDQYDPNKSFAVKGTTAHELGKVAPLNRTLVDHQRLAHTHTHRSSLYIDRRREKLMVTVARVGRYWYRRRKMTAPAVNKDARVPLPYWYWCRYQSTASSGFQILQNKLLRTVVSLSL